MAQVKLYTTDYCPYCNNAKRLLESKGAKYEEINLSSDPDELISLKNRTGMRTVPQIFIGETFVGGFSELSELAELSQLSELSALSVL